MMCVRQVLRPLFADLKGAWLPELKYGPNEATELRPVHSDRYDPCGMLVDAAAVYPSLTRQVSHPEHGTLP